VELKRGKINMKNEILKGIASGMCLCLLAASTAGAQNYNGKDISLAYNNDTQKTTTTSTTKTIVAEGSDIVDYPTISYPETAGFKIEKEKAVYHLSWQVTMRENLSYTEVQSSSDGVNFTTVGFVMNDGTQKNTTFDYFVPSDKNNTNSFRLIQHGLNARNHVSDVYRIQ
jgi:hypothetical protein